MSDENKKKLSEEDYLKKHLGNVDIKVIKKLNQTLTNQLKKMLP